MEASAAGLAAASGGEGQQQGEAGEAGQEQAQQQAPDYAAMQQQLADMASSQEATRQFLEQQFGEGGQAGQQQQPGQEAQPAETPDLSFLDETQPGYDPTVAAERLHEVIKNLAGEQAQQQLQQVVAPLQETVSKLESERESDALIAEFPELGDAEVAQAAVKTAEQYAEQLGNPGLVATPGFVRLTVMAARASELAQQQQSQAADSRSAATLEGAGGARPGGAAQGEQQETADSIAETWSERRNVLPRW